MGYIGDRVTVQWYADNRHYTGTVTGQPSVGQYMVQFDSHDIPRDYFGAPVYQHRFGPRVYGTSVVRVIDDLQSLERKKNGARHRLNDLQRQVRHLQNRAQEEKNRIARLDMRIAEVKEVLPDHLKLAILSFALYRHEVEDFCIAAKRTSSRKLLKIISIRSTLCGSWCPEPVTPEQMAPTSGNREAGEQVPIYGS